MDHKNLIAIDIHTHAEVSCRNPFDNYGEEYDRAADKFFGSDRRPTIAETVAYYRERKLGLVMFTVDSESQLGRRRIPNEEIAQAARENSDMMIAFASIDPHKGKMGAREAERLIKEEGIKGFKFHPTVQGYHPYDKMAWPIYEVINAHKLPAIFHTGHSGIGSGMRCGGGLRLEYSNPMHLDDVAIDFPDMQIVMAHPSFPWQDEALSVATHKPNVWIDLSGWSPKYFPKQLVQYANTLLKDRILFGSDYPLITPERWMKDFEVAGFKPEVMPWHPERQRCSSPRFGMKAFATLADIEALEQRPLAEVAPHRTPYELIRATATRFPEREAFTFLPDAGINTPPQRVTYRELLAHIHRAANAFRALGVHETNTVAMLAPNTPEAHAVLWGAQLAGRVCPINYLLQPDHIAALLQASGAKVLVALGPNAELAVWLTAQAVQRCTPPRWCPSP